MSDNGVLFDVKAKTKNGRIIERGFDLTDILIDDNSDQE